MSLLASLAVAPSTSVPRNTAKWRPIFQPLSRNDAGEEGEEFKPLAFGTDHSNNSSQKSNSRDVASSLDGHNQILEAHLDTKLVKQNEKEVIYMKLRQLALRQEPQELPMSGYVEDTAVMEGEPTGVEEQSEENPDSSSGCQSIAQVFEDANEITSGFGLQPFSHIFIFVATTRGARPKGFKCRTKSED